MAFTKRLALALVLPAALAACASTGGGSDLAADLAPAPAPAAVSGFEAGTQPEFCPNVTLREGTSILERPNFVASITNTSRDCRVADGKLFMQVGVTGRVTPKGAAGTQNVRLPVRVAVTRGDSVLYSTLGGVAVPAGAGTQTFAFVDKDVALSGPSDRTLTVFVGFDEGPPAGGGRTAAAQ